MKLHLVIVSFIFLAANTLALAQKHQANQGLLRERIAMAKFNYINEKLELSAAQAEQLRPLYISYNKELSQIGKPKDLRIDNISADSLTAAEADVVIANRFDFAQKQIDLRKKYHLEFKKVLSPQQIIKLYQAEAEIRQKLATELKNRRFGAKNQPID